MGPSANDMCFVHAYSKKEEIWELLSHFCDATEAMKCLEESLFSSKACCCFFFSEKKGIRIIWYPILETSGHALIFPFFPYPYSEIWYLFPFLIIYFYLSSVPFLLSSDVVRGSMTLLCLVKKEPLLKSHIGFPHTTFLLLFMFPLLYIMFTLYDCFSYLCINYLPWSFSTFYSNVHWRLMKSLYGITIRSWSLISFSCFESEGEYVEEIAFESALCSGLLKLSLFSIVTWVSGGNHNFMTIDLN